MISGLIGKKVGMTQIFDKDGNVIPVTVVEAGPCTVLELKDAPYKKVKLGFEPAKERLLTKPLSGYFKKLSVSPLKYLREFSSTDNKEYKVGQEIKADCFKAGEYVDVTGTSIGKGFQGGMKRWHWSGGGAAHGSMHHRRVGSIGSSSDPSRVFVGHHMPGHMGKRTVTVQGLRVMDVNVEKNWLLIKGALPGSENALVYINRSFKRKFRSLDEQKVVVAKKVNPMKQSKAKAGAGAKAKAKGK